MFACPGARSIAGAAARRLAGPALAEALRDSRRRTLERVADLDDAQWLPPYGPGVNPVAWELAHLAWFGEFWILRGPHRAGADGLVDAARPPRIAGPDGLFDSARLAHAQRWQIALPSRAELLDRLAAQLDACLRALPLGDDDAALYFHRLTLFHEDMHGEALAWMRAALAYPAPPGLSLRRCGASAGPIALDGGEFVQGWPADRPGFAFDNEQPARPLILQPFDIDATPVTAGQFLQFVEAGGYAEPALWPAEAGHWLAELRPSGPARWRRTPQGQWQQRWFDRWIALEPALPVIHVNAFEAEAFCRWAGRRLPRAAEWELAAGTAVGRGFDWGRCVWEWCADDFEPHDGFVPGPYRDYSRPWFGSGHRELRGGSFATQARLHEPRYRNFFMPQRSDVFAGFRTASPDRTIVQRA
jgi:ergothioneine biosynthesis protein EgtB